MLQWPSSAFVLMFTMTAIGSLLPDVDATDATILHGRYRPIGLFFKWVIYFPIAFLIGDKQHRGFFHSLEGLLVSILVSTSITTTYLYFINSYILIPHLSQSHLIVFDFNHFSAIIGSIAIGLGLGYIMHLYEDTMTVSGITWSYFGGGTFSGNIKVGTNRESFFFFALMLISLGNYLVCYLAVLLEIHLVIILITFFVTLFVSSFVLNRILAVF